MPISYKLDAVREIVTTIMEGAVEDHEVLAFARALGSDDKLKASFVGLVYATPEQNNLTANGVRQAAQFLANVSPVKRLAIVAPSDAMFGFARMYEIFGGEAGFPIQAFRDEASAMAWLGV